MTDAFSLNPAADKPLSGLSVLVTRPIKQAESLIKQLEQQGATVLHQPAIRIEPVINSAQNPIIESINEYDWIVFISKNAVEYGLTLLSESQKNIQTASLAAIGKATCDALKQHGYSDISSPEQGFDSEALLNSEAFSKAQIKGKKLLIIRGGKGREHLKDSLETRQATVTYLDVYSRQTADLTLNLADFNSLDVITVSSQQGLENLLIMLGSNTIKRIQDKLLICPSKRCSQKASELGFNRVETAANATDNAMLNCIVDKITHCQSGE